MSKYKRPSVQRSVQLSTHLRSLAIKQGNSAAALLYPLFDQAIATATTAMYAATLPVHYSSTFSTLVRSIVREGLIKSLKPTLDPVTLIDGTNCLHLQDQRHIFTIRVIKGRKNKDGTIIIPPAGATSRRQHDWLQPPLTGFIADNPDPIPLLITWVLDHGVVELYLVHTILKGSWPNGSRTDLLQKLDRLKKQPTNTEQRTLIVGDKQSAYHKHI